MGLDITAVRRASFAHNDPTCDDWTNHERVTILSEFAERADGLDEGCYTYASQYEFRAGSYSGYNAWRADLADMAHGVPPDAIWDHPERYAGLAFYELINFSDCEGTIGPKTAAKLVRDFRDYHARARAYAAPSAAPPGDDWWLVKYEDWAKAFYLAADGGFVSFH